MKSAQARHHNNSALFHHSDHVAKTALYHQLVRGYECSRRIYWQWKSLVYIVHVDVYHIENIT